MLLRRALTKVHLYVLAPDDRYEARIGNKDYFSSLYGLSPDGIASKVSEILAE